MAQVLPLLLFRCLPCPGLSCLWSQPVPFCFSKCRVCFCLGRFPFTVSSAQNFLPSCVHRADSVSSSGPDTLSDRAALGRVQSLSPHSLDRQETTVTGSYSPDFRAVFFSRITSFLIDCALTTLSSGTAQTR